MVAVIAKAKSKVSAWIGVLVCVGIPLLILYVIVLIPTITIEIIGWALIFMIPPTAAMIAIHNALMNRRWRRASAFLENPADQAAAVDAIVAIMDFPIKMPLFGLLAWAVGALFAVIGTLYITDGKLPISDCLAMFISVVSAAVIVTIYQFFRWRQIVDPVLEQILRQAPELLEKKLPVLRLDLKRSLLISLFPLIVLSLLIAELAGYRQAATALQDWIGNSHLEAGDLQKIESRIRFNALDDPAYRPVLVAELQGRQTQKQRLYFIEQQTLPDGKGKAYREMVRNVNLTQVFPRAIMNDLVRSFGNLDDAQLVHYNPITEEIQVIRKFTAKTAAGPRPYYLILGYPWAQYSSQLSAFILISVVLMAVVILLSTGVVVVIAREIAHPIRRLVEFTEEVASGKIHSDVFYHANDEVGDLALSLRRMSERLIEVLRRIRDAARSLDNATDSIRQSSGSVKDGANLQERAIDDVASAMAEMDVNIQGITDNVEVLSSSADESSSSIFEMNAAVKKINESVDILNQSINDVSSSINEMTVAADQVAGNVTTLSAVAEETATSMAEMDAAIREVEKNTKDTAEWSQSVIHDAEAGVNSVSRVTKGMREISSVVHSAQSVIERLGERVDEIGKIVQVIDDVANQTNLLALNAAIIAAQAGEHGRGFAVVSDEIKQLAERTSGSTREIHLLIRRVQEESRQAVGAVEKGARAVEEGVKLADQASRSLAKIMDSTQLAIGRVQGIARTTVEQAESSRQVSLAIDKVADMVNHISVATQQQSRGGAFILKATEEMKAASIQVKRNAEEQLQGSRLITKSIESITDMLYSINQAQQEQKRSSSQVVQLMERIKVVSQNSTRSSSKLADVVSALSREADNLREEMLRFQLTANKNGTNPR
jgi:methyl-accepting chemotaxis protein